MVGDVPENIANRWCEVWTPGVRQVVSMGITFVPVIGNFYSMMLAVGGYDPITGQHLSRTERVIAGIGAAIGIFAEARAILSLGDEVATVARFGDDVAREGDDATRFAGSCANSFGADTEVMTASGLKAISEVEAGDLVLAWDEATNTLGYFVVTDEISHLDLTIVQLVIAGETVYTTLEHPFWVEGKGWVGAGKLAVGDRVRRAEGESGVVSQVLIVYAPLMMYNLTVAGAHTFFVGEEK